VLGEGLTIGTVVNSGGVEEVTNGARYSTAINTIVSSGGTLLELFGGAKLSGTTIRSGGILEIGYGTTLSGYKVSSGVILEVAIGPVGYATSGGRVSNTTVLNGGALIVQSGGVANGTTVSSGAQMDLENGRVSGSLRVASGATVNALSGTNVVLATGGTITNSGVFSVENGGTLTLSGTVRNSGTLFASDGALVIAGVVSGGTTVIGNGTVDIQQASSENITFQLGGTGGLELDVASAYTGKVSGFGNGGNTSQYIDLANIAFNGNVSRSYSGNTTSGVLTVTSGATVVAKIAMVGNYTTSSFKLGADSSGHVQITDPPRSALNTASSGTVTSGGSSGASFIDKAWTFSGMVAGFGPHDHTSLPGIGFGAHTTLGHSDDGGDAGGTLLQTAGTHGAKLALLGHYMATSFVTAADWHGGTLVTDAQQTQQPLLAHPQA
jgi:fibronectin-binding autotransporter adhesin